MVFDWRCKRLPFPTFIRRNDSHFIDFIRRGGANKDIIRLSYGDNERAVQRRSNILRIEDVRIPIYKKAAEGRPFGILKYNIKVPWDTAMLEGVL